MEDVQDDRRTTYVHVMCQGKREKKRRRAAHHGKSAHHGLTSIDGRSGSILCPSPVQPPWSTGCRLRWMDTLYVGREGGRITRGPARSDGSRDDDGRKFPQRTSHNTMIRNVKATWPESRFSLFEILVFTMGCRSERKVTITVHATTIQMTYHKTILKTRFAYRLQARVSHKRPRIV